MTKKMRILFVLLFSTILASVTYADSSNDTLNQLLKNIHSMQASFTQTIVDNKGRSIQKSEGKMALQRPGQFRWQTVRPNAQLVIANGARLWIYDPDLEQVVVRSLKSQTGETPALLLSDANPVLESDYQVKSLNDASGLSWFVLIPKDKSSMMASIRMGFTGNQLSKMQLQDHLGHTTQIQFQQVKLNTPVASSQFRFAPPKNVDVIDETKKR